MEPDLLPLNQAYNTGIHVYDRYIRVSNRNLLAPVAVSISNQVVLYFVICPEGKKFHSIAVSSVAINILVLKAANKTCLMASFYFALIPISLSSPESSGADINNP